jgi:hypothetical protein
MICFPYNPAATLLEFALSAELLRESELSEIELAQLAKLERASIKCISRVREGLLLGDIIIGEDPRLCVHTIHEWIREITPSNMHGLLRLPERELITILRRHKDAGSPTWNQDYLRECEQLASERDPARIARWNTRYPKHPVQQQQLDASPLAPFYGYVT